MNKYIAECIGTFGLIFCGTGAMTINEVTNGDVTHVGIAITWGLIVMAMIYAFGHISGAHLNPAVTLGFAVSGRFSWKQVTPYILAQFIGAILASCILSFLFPESDYLGGTIPSIDPFKAFVIEVLLTFFLMLVILHVSSGTKEAATMAGVTIGGVVLLEAMFAGPVTNASMNPARSLAPALLSGHWNDQWLYVVAPLTGAFLAVFGFEITKIKT